MRQNIKYKWMLVLLAPLFMVSCQDYLDRDPLNQFAGDAFWLNENNATLALTGVYRGGIQMTKSAEYTPSDWWSYCGLVFLDMTTDNAYDRRGDGSAFNLLTNGKMTTSAQIVGLYWTRSYARIARCNDFLENIESVNMAEATINRMKSEARFVRACQYFYLSQFWGDVPLVKNTLTDVEANTVERTPKADVIQFAIDEFTEIVEFLPSHGELEDSERGRATKQAALAFLGRLQMGDERWAAAAATYEKIVALNENIIDPDFAGLFNGKNESSDEIIFATQFLADLAPNAVMQHAYPALHGGWHLFNPLGSLVESYEFIDGTPFSYEDPRYNPDDIGENRDPRLGYTINWNMKLFKGVPYVTHPDSMNSDDRLTTSKQATRTGFGPMKFIDESHEGDLTNAGMDIPIIRYAEVLLSLLESKMENGDAINQALLDRTINEVRGRSSVGLADVTETDKDKLREILRRERRNELAFEGIRLWDLFRWQIAEDVLNGDFYGGSYPGAVNLRKNGETVDPHSRWYVTSKAFRAQDYVWPIPQSEQNINPNLRD